MSDTTHAEAPGGSEPPRTSETSDAVTNGRKVVEYALSPRSVWMVIGAILLTLIGVEILDRTRNLISMLIIAFFFALAIIPLVERIHARRGWKRGAAVGVIFGLFALFLIVMVVFLIPMIVDVAQTIGANLSTWVDNLNQWAQDTFGRSLTDTSGAASAGQSAAGAAEDWASEALGGFLGALSTGIGLIFSTMTIALFTFYFAADHVRIENLILSWFSPKHQERLGWTWDQAVEQTGGYFYSRMILMVINGLGFFFTMVLVGMPVLIALPLAFIGGFISEFIPAVGTYIGGAIPVLLTLAIQGFAQGLIVLAYVLIYQQIENYYLSPKISAKTMTLNGGVAFGAALAGGAIGGPMGAFMALPVAALVTSFISHYRKPHEVVYHSKYDPEGKLVPADADRAPGDGSTAPEASPSGMDESGG